MSSLKNDKGSVLVFITLMIVLLMIMVGMGLDTGHLVYTRATGQGAVDAAALSAITALPQAKAINDANLVYTRAAAFVGTNDYTGSATNPIDTKGANVSFVQYDFGSNQITAYNSALGVANGVRVALEGSTAMKTPAFLTPLFRLFGSTADSNNNVSVSAVSVMTALPSIPIAVWNTQCPNKTSMELKVQPPGEENSCWTTYLDKSSGANDIADLFVASGNCKAIPQGPIDIGIPIYENKGTVATIYDEAKNLFITKFPGRCWIIPVITPPIGGNCNQKNPTPIVDWAEICPTAVDKHGAHSTITTSLTCGKSLQQTTANLCFSNRLVREHAKGM